MAEDPPSEPTADRLAARQTGESRIFAVVVTFNPDAVCLAELVAATLAQVSGLVMVDNGSREDVSRFSLMENDRIVFLPLGRNVGVAAAQNAGMELAKAHHATDILLLDHDSVPDGSMVARLLRARQQLSSQGIPVGAVGAVAVDRRTGKRAPVARSREGRASFAVPAVDAGPIEADYLIASGTLISIEALSAVGPMNESFFIDQVDVEWCFRAAAQGLRLFCEPAALLHHAIGERVIRVWLFRWRELSVHAPLRNYFFFRNTLALFRSGLVSAPWKRYWTRVLVLSFVAQTLCVAPRAKRLAAMTRGIRDGLRAEAAAR